MSAFQTPSDEIRHWQKTEIGRGWSDYQGLRSTTTKLGQWTNDHYKEDNSFVDNITTRLITLTKTI